MSEQQSSTQVGIIVVAHADYGSAMLRTAEFILGTLSDCTSISVDIAQEVPETVRRLDDAAQRLDKGAGVIILTDMFGGTPTNLALSLLGSHNVEVVTGVNLPMLLKVFTCREKPLAELAKLAGEVKDHSEKANSIFPSDAQRVQLRTAHLLEARASLMALDSRLTDCYQVMMQNPEGCFTTSKGKAVGPKDAVEKLDKMAQNLGELIDRENELLKGQIKSTGQRLKT